MNDIREKFEEIWPVPEGVVWGGADRGYIPANPYGDYIDDQCFEHDLRLDTFTRCQDTTDVYVSLISQLVYELEDCYQIIAADRGGCFTADCFDRAKQIMQKKK